MSFATHSLPGREARLLYELLRNKFRDPGGYVATFTLLLSIHLIVHSYCVDLYKRIFQCPLYEICVYV